MMLMQLTLLQLHFVIYIFIFPQLAEGQGKLTNKNLKVFQISNKVVFQEDSLQKYLGQAERGLIVFCPNLEFDSINYIQNAQNLLDDISLEERGRVLRHCRCTLRVFLIACGKLPMRVRFFGLGMASTWRKARTVC